MSDPTKSCADCAHFSVPTHDPPCGVCYGTWERLQFTPRLPVKASPAPLAPSMGNWRLVDRPGGRLRDDDDGAAVRRAMRR